MKSTLNFALIGCGGIAKRHIEWSLARPECDIVALCDTSEAALQGRLVHLQSIRPEAEVMLSQDYHDLLQLTEIDAVAVLLPHHLHYPVVKAALEAGKHVLVEKPMVTSVAQAHDLIDTARQANRHLAIAYQRAYLPEYAYVRQMVSRGELGQIQFVSAHLEQSWLNLSHPDNASRRWRRDPNQSGGGQLVDTGSHTIAAMLDVTQLTPLEVFAFMDNCSLDVDVNSALSVRFVEGALASIMIGGFGHSVTEVLRIVGDKASARIFFRTVREQLLEINGELVDAPSLIPRSNPNENFIDAVLGQATIAATGDLGLRVAQLSEAAYRSVETHSPVKVV